MVLFILFVIILRTLLQQTASDQRRKFVVIAFGFYLFFTFLDLCFLEGVLNRSFHLSDPTEYYEKTKDLSLQDTWSIESTNSFYFILNWIYNHIYGDTFLISLIFKLCNATIILISYLLLTSNTANFTRLDIILLFNPYLLVTIIRNVRDPYIILFVSLILVALKVIPNYEIKKIYLIPLIFLLSITRSILLIPFLILFISKMRKTYIYIASFVTLGVLYVFKDVILKAVVNQSISALVSMGENINNYISLYEGEYSFSTILPLIKRACVGLVSLIITPHPVRYGIQWMNDKGEFGTSNIYTGVDNVLIILGALYFYILILPYVIYYFSNWRKQNKELLFFILFFIIAYTLAYMGVTDIRNKHLPVFFILIGLITSGCDVCTIPYRRYAIISICICIGLSFL